MEQETFNIKEIIESRRHAAEKSLRTIGAEELKALADELFPYSDHPWLEKFSEVVNDPASGPIYHALVGDRIEVLYCRNKDIGMWFIHGIGSGPLQPDQLKIMQEIVAGT